MQKEGVRSKQKQIKQTKANQNMAAPANKTKSAAEMTDLICKKLVDIGNRGSKQSGKKVFSFDADGVLVVDWKTLKENSNALALTTIKKRGDTVDFGSKGSCIGPKEASETTEDGTTTPTKKSDEKCTQCVKNKKARKDAGETKRIVCYKAELDGLCPKCRTAKAKKEMATTQTLAAE